MDAKYLHRWVLVGGICPAFAFTAEGLPITMSFSALRTDLLLLDPRALDVLDSLSLPRRKGTIKKVLRAGLDELFRDTSGGAYFFMDAQERVVVPAADGEIWIAAIKREGGARRFDVVRKLSPHVPKGDKITACLPVWREQGAPLYWYTSAAGTVGEARCSRTPPHSPCLGGHTRGRNQHELHQSRIRHERPRDRVGHLSNQHPYSAEPNARRLYVQPVSHRR